MPRSKKIYAYMVNVVIHDEAKRNYSRLFAKAFDLKKIVKLNKINAATLLTLGEYNYSEQSYCYGRICRFIDIQPPYFDSDSRGICEDENGNPTYVINENIKSNVKLIDFMLFPDVHTVIVDKENISANYIKKFFEVIFLAEEIRSEFGPIAVNVVKTNQTIEQIMTLSNIISLKIILDRSNPTSLSRLDEDVQNSLQEQNADKIYYYAHSDTNNLQPNELTKSFARAAQINGTVHADYINENGHRSTIHSEEYPFIESYEYASTDDKRTILVKLGEKMLEILRR